MQSNAIHKKNVHHPPIYLHLLLAVVVQSFKPIICKSLQCITLQMYSPAFCLNGNTQAKRCALN